ncbi:hypothetical protein P692DRAFT_20883335 [Suillus brevipes Sb2]|nr:hypothetical protein P692DRAFT_20883335 [Suillus brevipes Sb2]
MRPSAISAIPLPPLEVPHEAPPVGVPQQPERALEQPAAAVMAPVHETRETIPLPPTPTLPIIEIAFAPAHIEAPIIGEPTEPKSDPEDQFDEVVSPQLDIREPSAIANASNALPDEIASPMVSNDLKHSSRFSAPIQEYSAVSELQNTPYLDQSLSLVNPLITDNTAHIAFSAFSDFRLPVKHPCTTSPAHHIEHVLGDPEAPPVHLMAPEVAQFMCLEAMYIQPSHISPFSLVSRFLLSMSFLSFANTLPSPSLKLTIIPSLRRHSRAPHALILAPKAPIIVSKFSLYRVFTTLSLLNRIPCIHHDLYFKQPSRRDLGARLTCTHPPTASIITFNFTSLVLIRIFRIFTYRVHITLSFSIQYHPFMTRRLWRLHTSSILIIRATFAPNFASHTSLTNVFSLFQPILAHTEDIIIFMPTCAKAPASPVAYHAAVHLFHPRLASPCRAPNRRHQVQEFIPPVTSPPLTRWDLVWTWVGPLPQHAVSPSTPWISLDIRLFTFPALCDAYATYATYALITHIRAPQAPQARIFPRLTHHSHATLASSSIIHCHHEFASLHPFEVAPVLDTAFTHFRFKRECSRASRAYVALSTRLDMSPSHHQQSIVMSSLHHYILLKSRYRSIPRSRTSASQARMFPRFARLCRLIHAHTHVALASLQSSPYHSGSHHHHIPECLLCLHTPESLRAFRCSTTLSRPYDALRLRLSRA